MTDQEFERLYQETLSTIEETIESFLEAEDSDLDYENVNGILTLDCGDGSSVIITPQGSNRQLWMAARSGGYHFDYDEAGGHWLNTINKRSLQDMLRENIRAQGGGDLSFPDL